MVGGAAGRGLQITRVETRGHRRRETHHTGLPYPALQFLPAPPEGYAERAGGEGGGGDVGAPVVGGDAAPPPVTTVAAALTLISAQARHVEAAAADSALGVASTAPGDQCPATEGSTSRTLVEGGDVDHLRLTAVGDVAGVGGWPPLRQALGRHTHRWLSCRRP